MQIPHEYVYICTYICKGACFTIEIPKVLGYGAMQDLNHQQCLGTKYAPFICLEPQGSVHMELGVASLAVKPSAWEWHSCTVRPVWHLKSEDRCHKGPHPCLLQCANNGLKQRRSQCGGGTKSFINCSMVTVNYIWELCSTLLVYSPVDAI